MRLKYLFTISLYFILSGLEVFIYYFISTLSKWVKSISKYLKLISAHYPCLLKDGAVSCEVRPQGSSIRNNKVGFACSTLLVYCNQLILLKNTTLYLRKDNTQRFEHYSSSGVKVS